MMKKQRSYPSDWEEVFNLILSLVKQVHEDRDRDKYLPADELENYQNYRLQLKDKYPGQVETQN